MKLYESRHCERSEAISRKVVLTMRLPRQHLKTLVFKCFLAMTANGKFRGDTSGSKPLIAALITY